MFVEKHGGVERQRIAIVLFGEHLHDREVVAENADSFFRRLHRFAISAALVLPSPIAVNTSSSIPAFNASVRWCALIV